MTRQCTCGGIVRQHQLTGEREAWTCGACGKYGAIPRQCPQLGEMYEMPALAKPLRAQEEQMAQEFEFELMQDGIRVATSWSDNRDRAWADILHYAMLYSQDGPVTIYEVTRVKGRKKRTAIAPEPVSTGWDSQSCFRVGG